MAVVAVAMDVVVAVAMDVAGVVVAAGLPPAVVEIHAGGAALDLQTGHTRRRKTRQWLFMIFWWGWVRRRLSGTSDGVPGEETGLSRVWPQPWTWPTMSLSRLAMLVSIQGMVPVLYAIKSPEYFFKALYKGFFKKPYTKVF